MECSFSFHAPADTMNLNEKLHWTRQAKLEKAWRESAGWAALQLPKSMRPCPGKIAVRVTLPVRGVRVRDPHNWSPTVKPIVDGLVDAKVVPDDHEGWVLTYEPVLFVTSNPKHIPGLVTVHVAVIGPV